MSTSVIAPRRLIPAAVASAGSWRLRIRSAMYQLGGIAAALGTWALLTRGWFGESAFVREFAPASAAAHLVHFVASDALRRHALPSLARVGIGLGVALTVGVPVGLLIGYSKRANLFTNAVFQFIRMTSPLAWMPVAIIAFGVGSRPIYFLIAVAAVWPILINTASGVRDVNPLWIRAVRMLGGSEIDVLRRAVIPAIIPDILTGVRIAIGVSWIVLVPAEMLGVSSGLGYYLLDTRDRFAYGELMAVIVVIGFFGFVSDGIVRLALRRMSWRSTAAIDDRL